MIDSDVDINSIRSILQYNIYFMQEIKTKISLKRGYLEVNPI